VQPAMGGGTLNGRAPFFLYSFGTPVAVSGRRRPGSNVRAGRRPGCSLGIGAGPIAGLTRRTVMVDAASG